MTNHSSYIIALTFLSAMIVVPSPHASAAPKGVPTNTNQAASASRFHHGSQRQSSHGSHVRQWQTHGFRQDSSSLRTQVRTQGSPSFGRSSTSSRSNVGRFYSQERALINSSRDFHKNNRYRINEWRKWPGNWAPHRNWHNVRYYTKYCWNGSVFPRNYFSLSTFIPTAFVFEALTGQVWQPQVGYTENLPEGYRAPITVIVQEDVPVYDDAGNAVGKEKRLFYYNAYWDEAMQGYGYVDYLNKIHWLAVR